MIKTESKKLDELTKHFAQALIDSKKKIDIKPILKQTDFNDVFALLYGAAHKALITSNKQASDLFEFLGGKIDAPNKSDYSNAIKIGIEEHYRANGLM